MVIGKIYKIIHNQSDIVYIGSTVNTLRNRWSQHKNRYLQYKQDPKKIMGIHPYFDKYGIDNFKIILIKEYEVVDKKHLESKEQLWMNRTKCVNIQSAFNALPKISFQIANKKYRELNIEYFKQYRELNKEKIKEFKKEYYELNKDKKKEYYEEKRIRINCECGGKYYQIHKLAHFKTKKHNKIII